MFFYMFVKPFLKTTLLNFELGTSKIKKKN